MNKEQFKEAMLELQKLKSLGISDSHYLKVVTESTNKLASEKKTPYSSLFIHYCYSEMIELHKRGAECEIELKVSI
jgi:hypothetical protein